MYPGDENLEEEVGVWKEDLFEVMRKGKER